MYPPSMVNIRALRVTIMGILRYTVYFCGDGHEYHSMQETRNDMKYPVRIHVVEHLTQILLLHGSICSEDGR